MKIILLIAMLASTAHADSWRVANAPSVLYLPEHACEANVGTWLDDVASQRPTITVDGDQLALTTETSTLRSSRALIASDYAIGFWDSTAQSTLVIRVRRTNQTSADVSIIVIRRMSAIDRGDACYVEWRGEAVRL